MKLNELFSSNNKIKTDDATGDFVIFSIENGILGPTLIISCASWPGNFDPRLASILFMNSGLYWFFGTTCFWSNYLISDQKLIIKMNYNHIVWDWNGTLLDDRWLCIEAINFVLKSREMRLVSTKEYRDLFCFPVIDVSLYWVQPMCTEAIPHCKKCK